MELEFKSALQFVTISTANSNLDGSGTTSLILTAGNNGTLLKTIIIKAQTNTQDGMIRFFLRNFINNNYSLLMEIPVYIVTKSSRDCSFQLVLPLNYSMMPGDKLYVSTQVADTFNIIVEALNWVNPSNSTPTENINVYVETSGAEIISTANSNLDGTGTTVQIFQAGAAATYNGCELTSILIKAMGTTTPGMIRLFIANSDGSSKTLFAEVVVPSVTQNGTNQSFSHQVLSQGSLSIRGDLKIYASTQNSENFSVIIAGSNWKYQIPS
ncbi:MAG: hypothetical protein V9E90_08440 [Saprospiraceae bacterium]|jgi:hypothetical protein|nr:hypothetical protein [Saprospiraceae bacterium]